MRLHDALESDEPGTVLVNMNCNGISPEEAIHTVKSQCPNTRLASRAGLIRKEEQLS